MSKGYAERTCRFSFSLSHTRIMCVLTHCRVDNAFVGGARTSCKSFHTRNAYLLSRIYRYTHSTRRSHTAYCMHALPDDLKRYKNDWYGNGNRLKHRQKHGIFILHCDGLIVCHEYLVRSYRSQTFRSEWTQPKSWLLRFIFVVVVVVG